MLRRLLQYIILIGGGKNAAMLIDTYMRLLKLCGSSAFMDVHEVIPSAHPLALVSACRVAGLPKSFQACRYDAIMGSQELSSLED